MRVLVQRVKSDCRIVINQNTVREFFGVGLVAYLGWEQRDEKRDDLIDAEEWVRSKVSGLRIFPDIEGRMNLNLETYLNQQSVEGGILWVSQFTLAGELDSGFRPSFTKAMKSEMAKTRFENFCQMISIQNTKFKNIFGEFGADMDITYCNWGPVSILLER